MKKNKKNKCADCCKYECESENGEYDSLFRNYMDEIAAASESGESIEAILSDMDEEYKQSRRMIMYLRYRMQVLEVTLDFIGDLFGVDLSDDDEYDEDDEEDDEC